MSMTALLISSRNLIRTALNAAPFSLVTNMVQVMPSPQPSPNMGKLFVSIYGTEHKPEDIDLNRGLDERFGMGVTVSMKTSYSPYDRQGHENYITDSQSLDNICREIVSTIHQSIPVITGANTLITGNDKVVEFFRWLGTDPQPIPVPPSWFWSDDERKLTEGLIMEVRFGLARRVQTYANME